MLRSCATSKPTVNDEDLVKLQKFTEDFGKLNINQNNKLMLAFLIILHLFYRSRRLKEECRMRPDSCGARLHREPTVALLIVLPCRVVLSLV